MRSLGLAAGLLLLLIAPAAAAAPSVKDKSATVKAAAGQFAALAQDPARQGKVPRQTEPAAGQLLNGVFDPRPPGQEQALPFDDTPLLVDWLQAVLQAGLVYILADTGYKTAADLAHVTDLQKLNDQSNRNAVTYAPEVGRFYDAQMAVSGALARCVQAQIDRHPDMLAQPNVQHGLARMKNGMVQTLSGEFTTVALGGLTDAWRLERVAAVKAEMAILLQFLDAEQRAQISRSATEAASHAMGQPVRDALTAMSASFGATP